MFPFRLPFDPANFDFALLPSGPGVFLLETGGEPFVGKSAMLRRRLERLLGAPEKENARRLNLRDTTLAIRYRGTGSAFETSVTLYRAMRETFPGRYRSLLRLRSPALLKVNLANPYPRCYVTRRLGRGPGLYYGPFPSRSEAEKFSNSVLDLFLVRRCVEPIRPDPAHPGCIYGEMSMCLRPCQGAATQEQYSGEVDRFTAFLSSGGASLLQGIEGDRNRASEELNFEEAARLHKRVEKIHEALKQHPGLATDLERLHGVVIQPSAQASAVELFPVWRGFLQPNVTLTFEVVDGKPVSLDARLRQLLSQSSAAMAGGSGRVRAEHLALLARWYYRGRRVGEFVPFESYEKLPLRKIVGAVGRVARRAPGDSTGSAVIHG